MVLSEAQARLYSADALAFYGDSVYEELVRRYLVLQSNRAAARLHEEKIQLVCAEFQAEGYDKLLSYLTETEMGVLKRGRNAAVHVPRHTTAMIYHKATGLEALFGYLALIGAKERLEELFEVLLCECKSDPLFSMKE